MKCSPSTPSGATTPYLTIGPLFAPAVYSFATPKQDTSPPCCVSLLSLYYCCSLWSALYKGYDRPTKRHVEEMPFFVKACDIDRVIPLELSRGSPFIQVDDTGDRWYIWDGVQL